ncbi:MAG: hypothetical protein R3E08_08465 [Thiotrichaceae bacterium]
MRATADLQNRELSQFKVNLNISGHSLNDKTFVNSVVDRLSMIGSLRANCVYEITGNYGNH